MTRSYEFNINVYHMVYVEADSLDEAEELAMDQFSDDAGFWDSFDLDLIHSEEI